MKILSILFTEPSIKIVKLEEIDGRQFITIDIYFGRSRVGSEIFILKIGESFPDVDAEELILRL